MQSKCHQVATDMSECRHARSDYADSHTPHADSITPCTATRASYESDTSHVAPETSYVLSFLL